MRKLFLIFFMAFSLVPASAETLQIGIEHSEYMPPVSSQGQSLPTYNAGVSQRVAPRPQEPIIEWFQMPRAMAGKWTKQGDITVDVTDLRTGMARQVGSWTENVMTVTMGHQMDRTGNVWHVNIIPTERDSFSNGKAVRFVTVQQACEKSTPSMLCTRTHYIITETYGGSGQVADMFQQESLNQYTILPTGELQNFSSNRVFTYSGQAVRDGTLQSKFRRVSAFQPTAELNGVDLASALNRYLIALGRTDLVTDQGQAPTQLQAQTQTQFSPSPYQQPYQPQTYQQPYQSQYQQPSYQPMRY